MKTLRKYWFMIFLVFVLVAYIVTLVVPSWEREISTKVGLAFLLVVASYLANQLDRIEGKLDAVLKKLNKS
jgi:hypothetical protein